MRSLGDLEAAVMEIVWVADNPVVVRDVLVKLTPERPLAYTTVMTVMDNLFRKGVLRREKEGRAWMYAAVMSRGEYIAQLMREVLASADDQTAALSHFVASMSDEESAAMRTMLRRRLGAKP